MAFVNLMCTRDDAALSSSSSQSTQRIKAATASFGVFLFSRHACKYENLFLLRVERTEVCSVGGLKGVHQRSAGGGRGGGYKPSHAERVQVD